ncbi:unnamed protein product [Nesidiocoris tenuis]|uniref:Uncharacterized protein n=1 Tax=Nesidiocoris tenuis TaxID=355587 RepID=A0A6H5GMT7_9HEMI|nr:unnamed protein product [Nesidiocoris tenuis]
MSTIRSKWPKSAGGGRVPAQVEGISVNSWSYQSRAIRPITCRPGFPRVVPRRRPRLDSTPHPCETDTDAGPRKHQPIGE